MKTLILPIGAPRCGKTTWCRKISPKLNAPIVNPDSIRLAIHNKPFDPSFEPKVWETCKYMVESLFLAGHSAVILDATNVTPERRAAWKDYYCINVVFDTPIEKCIERAIMDKREDLIPVIERMFKTLVLPEKYVTPESFLL